MDAKEAYDLAKKSNNIPITEYYELMVKIRFYASQGHYSCEYHNPEARTVEVLEEIGFDITQCSDNSVRVSWSKK